MAWTSAHQPVGSAVDPAGLAGRKCGGGTIGIAIDIGKAGKAVMCGGGGTKPADGKKLGGSGMV